MNHDGNQQWVESVFGQWMTQEEAGKFWAYGMEFEAEQRVAALTEPIGQRESRRNPPRRVGPICVRVGAHSKGEQVPNAQMLRFTCEDASTTVEIAYQLLEQWVAVMPSLASDDELRDECARRGINVRPGAAEYGEQPTIRQGVERVAYWLDGRAEGEPEAIHQVCGAIDDTLLDQHRDETTVRSPKLRADVRGFIVAAYEEGKKRGSMKACGTDRTSLENRLFEAPDEWEARCREQSAKIRDLSAELAEATCRDCDSPSCRSPLHPHSLSSDGRSAMRACVERGEGIAALPELDDSHWVLDEDLLAEDA